MVFEAKMAKNEAIKVILTCIPYSQESTVTEDDLFFNSWFKGDWFITEYNNINW